MFTKSIFAVYLFALLGVVSCVPVNQLDDPSPLEVMISELKTDQLPFVLTYGGIKIRNAEFLLSQGGFSHVMLGSTPSQITPAIPSGNRAILWTGVAGIKDSPWKTAKSPWGNDLTAFQNKWDRQLKRYVNSYQETGVVPTADLIVLDIEAERQGRAIEVLRTEGPVDETSKRLDSKEFAQKYKREMLDLSAAPVRHLKSLKPSATTRYSSYGDAPISRNWYGIPKHSWEEWKNEQSLGNYMGLEGTGIHNPFAEELNVITPSAYYFKNTPQNLSYLLFQIEANRAHSEKELILFVTPRFVGTKTYGTPINENLAEATAIFPFFSGANGLWLWEKSTDRSKTNETEILPAYKGFFKGLERIGQYHRFFKDDFILHIPFSAHQAFTEKLPVWRAVVKNNEILIAAQNPYSKPGEKTIISVQYKGWLKDISLVGNEIYLSHFKL
jgi:hypothetical protein